MIITKADFTDNLVRFSQNVPDALINPDIADAIRFDLPDVLPHKILTVVLTADLFTATDWDEVTAYQIDDYVRVPLIVDGLLTYQVWKALADNTASPPFDGSADWLYDDLASFIDAYVKPYMVLCAYYRYKLENGIIPTPSGDRIFREDESDPISASQHASQLSKYKAKRGDYALLLQNELRRRGYLLDSVQYDVPGGCRTSNNQTYRGGITAIT
jgi:hypothetical protein